MRVKLEIGLEMWWGAVCVGRAPRSGVSEDAVRAASEEGRCEEHTPYFLPR